jgi:hypothetical protein
MTLQEELETFMTNWNGVHVTKYDDYLTYKVVHGFAQSATYRANQLIDQLGLSLIAEKTTENTFIVKQKQNEK